MQNRKRACVSRLAPHLLPLKGGGWEGVIGVIGVIKEPRTFPLTPLL
jgi:hypothetical protein